MNLKLSRKGENLDMYQIKNFLSNENVKVLEDNAEKGYKILEFDKDLSVINPTEAIAKYYASQMNCKERTAMLMVDQNNSWTLSSGAMKVMIGNVNVKTDVRGVGDLLGKALKANVTKESAIKPVYHGNGNIVLENTYKHILAFDTKDWGGSIIMNDTLYLASSNLNVDVKMADSVSGALLGNEGLFNTIVRGDGTVLIESPKPKSELLEVILKDDVIKVDGPYAICWSEGLRMTVERTTKTLIGSAASGEGLVNVFRGTGKLLMYVV